MNGKKRFIVVLCVLVLITFSVTSYIYAKSYLSSGSQNITSVVNTARYIMFGGAYNVNETDRVDNAVFKLDTYTGDTWILNVQLNANGKQSRIWMPVDLKTNNISPVNSPESQRINGLYTK